MIELQTLVDFFQSHGYSAVFFVLILCGFGLPIPEDVTLISGGIISGLGLANVHIMFLVSMAGVLLGDSIMFYIGYRYGERFLQEHHLGGKKLSHKRVLAVQKLLRKYGKRVIFAARFIPGFRAVIFATAGITRFCRFRTFIMIDGFAALISVPIWVYLGYYGATQRDWLMEWFRRGQIGVIIAVGAGIIIVSIVTLIKRKIRNLEKKIETEEGADISG